MRNSLPPTKVPRRKPSVILTKRVYEKPETIMIRARKGPVTILFGAKEERYNNAVALKEFIESELPGKPAAL